MRKFSQTQLFFSNRIVLANLFIAAVFLVLLIPRGAFGGTFTLGTGSSQTVSVHNDLVLGTGVTVSASSNNPIIDVDGDFTAMGGSNFTGGSQSMTVGTDGEAKGDFTLESGAIWNAGSGTLILDGGDDTDLVYFEDKNSSKQNMGSVQIGASPATTNLSSDMSATNLTVNTGDTLNTKGYDLDIADYITVNGTLNCTDNGEADGTDITLGGNWTVASGATFTADEDSVKYTTVTFDHTGTATLNSGGTDENHDFFQLSFNKSSAATTTLSTYGIDIEDDLSIASANSTLAAAGFGITVGGSWSNSGTFTHGNGTVTFDSADTGETINSGGTGSTKALYDVTFNNAGGGWTVQTNNVTIDRNLNFTSVSSWANTKTTSIRVGGTLTVSANQDIRTWNTSAISYSVDSSGSLYSMDHNSEDGVLYIWGDYHVNTNDYWSYAADFDNTGVSRRAAVKIDSSSNVTVDSGDTLAAIGGGQGFYTVIERQGTSGGYGLINDGGTINFNYADFENLDGDKGLDIRTGSTVTSLDFCKFNNLVGIGTTDAFITVASSVIGVDKTLNGLQFDDSNGDADLNVNYTGTEPSFTWSFTNATGSFDGEAFDGANGSNEADPGKLTWTTIDSANSTEVIEGSINIEGSATFN